MLDLTSFDKSAPESLYLQLRRRIVEAIEAGVLVPGQQVPSLNDICDRTGISRMTVRRAIDLLTREEWLETVPGKGTFVASKERLGKKLQFLRGWTEELRAKGFAPSTRLVHVRELPAPAPIATDLHLIPGDLVFEIARVRAADGVPLALETVYLSCRRFPTLGAEIARSESLYGILRDRYGVTIARAIQSIEAGQADAATAALLEIPAGASVLRLDRVSFGADGTPVEYTRSTHRADFVRFVTDLNADPRTSRVAAREISRDIGRLRKSEGG